MLIGDVARASGVSARMLRHYDRIGLLRPTGRTSGGYREYAAEDLARLLQIEGLRSLGLGLAQIGDVLDEAAFRPDAVVAELIERTRDQLRLAQELIERLRSVQDADPDTWTDVLRTVDLLRGLGPGSPQRRQRVALSALAADARDVSVLVDALLREADENAAGALQWALARVGDTAVPLLSDALRADEADVRRRAADALAKIGSPAAMAALANSDAEDDRLRGRALLVRARQGDAAVMPALVALIEAGEDDVEAADALGALAAAADAVDTAVAEISRVLAGAEPPARRRLVAALAALPGAASAAVLTARTADEDPGTALTARALLGPERDPDAV